MPKSFPCLKRILLSPYYFPRKRPEQLCCVVDLNKYAKNQNEIIYPVPIEIEHIDFVSKLRGNNVRDFPQIALKIIPSNLLIRNSEMPEYTEVCGILTGYSGIEVGFGVRHYINDLNLAHKLMKEFVERGEINFSENIEEKIEDKYSLYSQPTR